MSFQNQEVSRDENYKVKRNSSRAILRDILKGINLDDCLLTPNQKKAVTLCVMDSMRTSTAASKMNKEPEHVSLLLYHAVKKIKFCLSIAALQLDKIEPAEFWRIYDGEQNSLFRRMLLRAFLQGIDISALLGITHREREILALIRQGSNYGEISETMFISHVSRRKLDAVNALRAATLQRSQTEADAQKLLEPQNFWNLYDASRQTDKRILLVWFLIGIDLDSYPLGKKERQILLLIREGKTKNEIAQIMEISSVQQRVYQSLMSLRCLMHKTAKPDVS